MVPSGFPRARGWSLSSAGRAVSVGILVAPGACISPDPTMLPTALLYGYQHSRAPAALLLTLRTLCVMSEVGKILHFCRFLQVQRAHTKPGSCVPVSPHQLNNTQSSAHTVPRPFPGGKGWTGGARQRQESAHLLPDPAPAAKTAPARSPPFAGPKQKPEEEIASFLHLCQSNKRQLLLQKPPRLVREATARSGSRANSPAASVLDGTQ